MEGGNLILRMHLCVWVCECVYFLLFFFQPNHRDLAEF